jgi:hypothetical protein
MQFQNSVRYAPYLPFMERIQNHPHQERLEIYGKTQFPHSHSQICGRPSVLCGGGHSQSNTFPHLCFIRNFIKNFQKGG